MMIELDFLLRTFEQYRAFPVHLVIEKINSVWVLITTREPAFHYDSPFSVTLQQ